MDKFKDLIAGETPVLVDFFATWCGPCKVMHPILEQVKHSLGESLRIVKVDIDKPGNRPLVETHRVASVPTLLLFAKGEVRWRHSGVVEARTLEKIINQTNA